MDWLLKLDYSPLWISLKTGIVAAVLSGILGIFAAGRVYRMRHPYKEIADSLLTIPMVLPPTAAGFLLLLVFSRKRAFGFFLSEKLHIQVIQTWTGCVLAAMVIAFPLMYRSARAAFEQVDRNTIYCARTLGISERRIFWKILVPQAQQGILSGFLLSFARAMGEYGATSMLAGNIAGRTSTISQKIAMVIQDGDYRTAGFWVALVVLASMLFLLGVNLLAGSGNAERRKK